MINLVIHKPGVFVLVFKPTLTTMFTFLLSHFTDLAGIAIFRKWYIVYDLFPLTHCRILFMPGQQINVILPLFPASSGILHFIL